MNAIDGMACAKPACENRGNWTSTSWATARLPRSRPTAADRCTVCVGTLGTNTGTAYSGLRCSRREFDQVASLRVEGVSISATARVRGHSRTTIARWLERASTAAKRFNQWMLRGFDILELQADALCAFSAASAARCGCLRPSRCGPGCGPGACSAAATLETPRLSSTTSSSADAWLESR